MFVHCVVSSSRDPLVWGTGSKRYGPLWMHAGMMIYSLCYGFTDLERLDDEVYYYLDQMAVTYSTVVVLYI